MAKTEAVLVDIDGTLAIMGDRSPFDWHRVGEDTPADAVIRVVQQLAQSTTVIYLSGRDGSCRRQTQMWLDHHVGVEAELLMRANGDQRKDSIVKKEIYKRAIKPKYDVWLVLDDRDQVVQMWRELGLVCFQVAPGNF